jgi:hypothetical protein
MRQNRRDAMDLIMELPWWAKAIGVFYTLFIVLIIMDGGGG